MALTNLDSLQEMLFGILIQAQIILEKGKAVQGCGRLELLSQLLPGPDDILEDSERFREFLRVPQHHADSTKGDEPI